MEVKHSKGLFEQTKKKVNEKRFTFEKKKAE
jgi:hypothetical protein